MPPDPDYCARYGINETRLAAQLRWFNLTAAEKVLADLLQRRIIQPHLDDILQDFSAQLNRLPPFRQMSGSQRERFALILTEYIRTLGIRFDSLEYADSRLRVGLAHQAAGIPLDAYHASYVQLQLVLLDYLALPDALDPDTCTRVRRFILKITGLDMALAIATYHQRDMDHLKDTLEAVEERAQALQHRADVDELTGLLNWGAIGSQLSTAVAEACAVGEPLSVIMADLDFFKKVNDTHGHPAGDIVLQQVARRISVCVAKQDFVGRYGGEEFLIILPGTTLPEALKVAERIRQRIGQDAIEISPDLAVRITISLGVATLRAGDSAEALLQRADDALYAAKGGGRNRVAADSSS